MTSAYPLSWPLGKPRTPRSKTLASRFKSGDKPVGMAAAFDRLEDQVSRLGGANAILSSNVELTMSGRPRADRRPPEDVGVCLYFNLKGAPYAMACDTFRTVEQNIAAVAAHIEASRRIETYGVSTAAEALAAFMALPPPASWRQTLGHGPERATQDSISQAYRAASKAANGNEALQTDLNLARDRALKEISQ